MGFKGRIIAILFIVFCRAFFILMDITNHEEVRISEIIFSILMVIPMYFFGHQYDKARYYSKEVKDIFEDGHIMLWKWESKMNSAIVSSGCYQIYGYSHKEFHHDPQLWLKVVYEKDKRIAEEFQKETLTGKQYSSQYRIVHKNGKIKWVQNMANPIFSKNGNFIKVNGVTIDITKQKEKDLNYRKLIDASPIANIMIKDGKILYINFEGMKLLGADSLQDIVGKDLLEFITDEQHHLSNQRIKQLTCGNFDKLSFHEYKVKKLNGTLIDVESTAIKTSYNDEETILVVAKDITNEKRVQRELKQVLKELQDIKFALEVSAIVSITDTGGKVIYVNDKFCEISQYQREELIGKSHEQFTPDFDTDQAIVELRETIGNGHVWKGDMKRKSKNGRIYWLDTTIVPILDENNQPLHFISIQYDITEKITSQQEVKYMAFYDSLTGLLNRNSLNKYLEEQLKILDPAKETLSVLFIDFDRFKSINDTLGHTYGDLMLQKAAEILIECTNHQKEQVFRYGGDEFIIVLHHINSSEVEAIAQKIINQFSDSLLLQGVEVFTTPSIGISLFPNDGDNVEDLLKAADMAMYSAKENGKNNYKFFHVSIGEKASKSVVIERELRRALKEDQFILYFQPKICLNSNEIVGYEALIRWNHPDMGMIQPCDFISIAEETGLINKLGEWVLEEACRKVQEINKIKNRETPIAINISVKQFTDPHFVKKTKEIIKKTRCKPSLLEFEITETVMQDVFASIKIVRELKEMGIKISMDDFGTGYSNLSILSEMDIDILKIDRSFVKKMCENTKSHSLVKTIIKMGHSLGFQMVAEGIETIEQLEALKHFQCEIGQGYYFSRPLSIEEIIH